MARLTGRVAVITGGARGNGAAIAQAFVAEGARVAIADVLIAEGKVTADELGSDAMFVPLDVTDAAAWPDAVSSVTNAFGPVSILVNNAGILAHDSVESMSPETFRRVLDVNLVGAWLGIRAVTPAMRAAGDGVIINVSSTAGLVGQRRMAAYAASKWGLRGLTRTAAQELAADGIRVCSIHPGAVRTPMTAGFDEDQLRHEVPLARIGEPTEVAAMALFIAADATYSTGCEFVMDGGITA